MCAFTLHLAEASRSADEPLVLAVILAVAVLSWISIGASVYTRSGWRLTCDRNVARTTRRNEARVLDSKS